MTIWKGRANRKASGGKYKPMGKKKYALGIDPRPTVLGKAKEEKTPARMRGGKNKTRLVKALFANVSNGSKVVKSKIITVSENNANRHFVRQNVVTRGAKIKTELGDAIVTSRPSQQGVVNAKLVK